MNKFSQNNKIAISAIAVFLASFSLMLFFLGDKGGELNHVKTDVLQIEETDGKSIQNIDLEAAYREYLGNMEDPIFVTDADGTFVFSSENFCAILGTKCRNLLNKKFFDFVNSEDLPVLVEEYTHLIQEPGKIDGIGPIRMIKKNKERLILLSAKPLTDENGEFSGIIFAVKDITEQVDELQDDLDGDGEVKEPDSEWLKRLYPKIKEMNDADTKVIVDKISYKKE